MNYRYVSLDGHTRLYLAHKKRLKKVCAVISCTDDWILQFVEEAKKRCIYCPCDLQLVSQEEYEIFWNAYCDNIFDRK